MRRPLVLSAAVLVAAAVGGYIAFAPGNLDPVVGDAASDLASAALSAVTGAEVEIGVDMTITNLSVQLSDAGDWAEGLPRIETFLTPVDGGDRITIDQRGRQSRPVPVPFGTYEVFTSAQPTGRTGSDLQWRGEVEVTAQTHTLIIPLNYWMVEPQVIGAEALVPQERGRIDVRVIATSHDGYDMGATHLEAGQPEAPILFAHNPEFEPLTYALAIVDGNGIQAIAPFETPAPGTLSQVSITVGEGRELCMPLFAQEDLCTFTATQAQ